MIVRAFSTPKLEAFVFTPTIEAFVFTPKLEAIFSPNGYAFKQVWIFLVTVWNLPKKIFNCKGLFCLCDSSYKQRNLQTWESWNLCCGSDMLISVLVDEHCQLPLLRNVLPYLKPQLSKKKSFFVSQIRPTVSDVNKVWILSIQNFFVENHQFKSDFNYSFFQQKFGLLRVRILFYTIIPTILTLFV